MWAGSRDVHPADLLTVKYVGGQLPPCRVRVRAGRRRCCVASGFQPGEARVLRVDGVEAGERDQEQADADRHRRRDKHQPRGSLPAATQRQPNPETNHEAPTRGAGDVTRPSRTMTSRSAYAATRGSCVTSTTVTPCSRAASVSRSMT